MKRFVCLAFLFSSFGCFAQSRALAVGQQEYYEFFNAVPNPLAEVHPLIQSEPILFNMYDAPATNDRKLFDTVFSKNDTAFLVSQAIKAKSFYWGPGMINGATVVNKSDLNQIIDNDDAGWDRFDKMYRTQGYWVYSVPLFSVDKSLCVVKYSNYWRGGQANYVFYYKLIDVNDNNKPNDPTKYVIDDAKPHYHWKAIYHYRTIINY